jgi:hypothetical protein
MVGATDQKTEWSVGETVLWICTRDHDRVASMWDISEFEAIAFAFFNWQHLPQRVIRTTVLNTDDGMRAATAGTGRASGQLPGDPAPAGHAVDAEGGDERAAKNQAPAGSAPGQAPSKSEDQPRLDRILRDVMRKVQTRKVRMTMIRAGETGVGRLPVSAREANELELRITDDLRAPVVAWSRTQEDAAGTSPWFSRTDVIRAWPERLRKTAAVAVAILRHLNEISTPERPLTRPEARDRCLAEVANAYPEAFKRAWARLDPSRKRGRGKHGPIAR